jgi:hypothetical protein
MTFGDESFGAGTLGHPAATGNTINLRVAVRDAKMHIVTLAWDKQQNVVGYRLPIPVRARRPTSPPQQRQDYER